jgi:hypothetical protein
MLVTETQINCSECGDTGYVPPFMDPCTSCHLATMPVVSGTVIASPVGPTGPTGADGSVEWRTWDGSKWVPSPAPDNADELLAKTFAPSGAKMSMPPKMAKSGTKMASDAQMALLTKLIAERDSNHPNVKIAVSEIDGAALTAKAASNWITTIMAIPADPTKKTSDKPNNYDGPCKNCGGNVPAKTGYIEKVGGKWTTFHKAGACLTADEAAKLEADKVTEPGLYRYATLGATPVIYRVKWNMTKTRLYGEVVVPPTEPHGTVQFLYNGKAMSFLRASDKLTWNEAREFGAAYGSCVACGRTLSDDRSLVQGYGPKCADNHGWPTVTTKQAKAILADDLAWEDVVIPVVTDIGSLTS